MNAAFELEAHDTVSYPLNRLSGHYQVISYWKEEAGTIYHDDALFS